MKQKTKLEITAAEFDQLKQFGEGPIIRDGYSLSHNPEMSIKIYHGTYEGLKKVEVEFDSEEAAQTSARVPDSKMHGSKNL
jgi:hypothetical protein